MSSGDGREVPRAPRVIAGIPQDEILRRLRSDDMTVAQDALRILYEAFFKPLWRVAYRVLRSLDLAEEMVQEVFLGVWEQRQSLVIRDTLSLYLHVAIRNRSYDHLRHSKVAERHAAVSESTPEDNVAPSTTLWPSAVSDPAQVLAETEADRALLQALAGISERDRDILILRWREGWSFDEIGRAVGVSSVAARIVVSRQQRRLRTVLDQLREELREP